MGSDNTSTDMAALRLSYLDASLIENFKSDIHSRDIQMYVQDSLSSPA